MDASPGPALPERRLTPQRWEVMVEHMGGPWDGLIENRHVIGADMDVEIAQVVPVRGMEPEHLLHHYRLEITRAGAKLRYLRVGH